MVQESEISATKKLRLNSAIYKKKKISCQALPSILSVFPNESANFARHNFAIRKCDVFMDSMHNVMTLICIFNPLVDYCF